MISSKILNNIYKQGQSASFSSGFGQLIFSQNRSIFATAPVRSSRTETIKGSPEDAEVTTESFTLLRFADELSKARASSSESKNAFEKQEAIIRYLGGLDPTGVKLEASQKQAAAKQCNCSIADVENVVKKFTWAKEAHIKIISLKEEGKPMPKSMAELQKLMGTTPFS